MNHITLIGRLTAEPEIRSTQTGVQVATFTVAVNRRFSDHDGNKPADFIPVVAWRKLAEICGQYLTKGSKIAVEGALQTRKFEDKNGARRTAFEVVASDVEFLDSRERSTAAAQEASASEADVAGFEEMDDAQLPF